MKYMHSEWRDRLAHWMNTLERDFYLPLGPIEVEAFVTREHLTSGEAAKRAFSPMAPGTAWGETWEYCWMRARIVLPERAEGRRVAMDLRTGGETTVFVDGRSFGTYRAAGIPRAHHYLVDNFLTGSARAGQAFELLLEAYAGHFFPHSPIDGCATGPVLPGSCEDPLEGRARAALGEMTYGIWNEDAYQLWLDLTALAQLGDQVDPESLRADRIASALERATLIVDFEQELDARVKSYREARRALAPALAAKNGSTAPEFYAIGNAHLDLAWLWPMEETRRKTSRTFAQQLRLLEEYPEYLYLQSQPAAYEMCRERYPELYARIREAIREGRWIAEGAMWVEPDTNMTSGESLVRQLIHGKRYFRDELGVDSVVLWLPDTFGYSAALPQILRGCGVKYLVTQKIFWSYNEGDRFPYHYFTWQGADGSKIDTFLPTSYTYRTDPKELCETWNARVQKRGLDAFLLPFGYGDGGGGPCRDHIEFLRRERDLEGMPRVKMASPVAFFREMEEKGGPQHTYVGELYFSAHRGVFTSQAAIKRGNRKGEIALREAELWGALATLAGYAYPLSRMDAAWKRLLLNQFHDILPGSSIARVYEDARRDHAWILGEAEAVRDEALAALVSDAEDQNGANPFGGEAVTVFNSVSFEREGLVRLSEAFACGARTLEGEAVPVQRTPRGVIGLVRVSACGAVSLVPCGAAEREKTPESAAACGKTPPAARAILTASGAVIENGFVRAELNARGEVVSFIDKASGREFAAGPMNRLCVYKDVPRKFDAWDIDSSYALQPVAADEPVRLSVTLAGGLLAVIRVERALLHSAFAQDIVLAAHSRRLDFETTVDWRELHRLLKVSFPAAVQASEAINEIQFGYLSRPAHRSRLYDSDRFEVCNQRYSAVCDQGAGVAVLNDCKYGISMEGGDLRLTLLRASASPEMRADNGAHTFTYSLTAWTGDFLHSPVVREAYDLNVPLQTASGARESFCAFSLDAQNVFIDTVKPAEDGSGDIVLRLYEAKRAATRCSLAVHVPAREAWLCDMLENPIEEVRVEGGRVALSFGTFEVKTLRLKL